MMTTRSWKNRVGMAGLLLAAMLVWSGFLKAGIPSDYTYTTFAPPDESYRCIGINDNGEVVGQYTRPDGRIRGFLFSDGVYTPLGNPMILEGDVWREINGDVWTEDINDSGVVAGSYSDWNFGTQGFKYSNGVYQMISPEHVSRYAHVMGINDSGQVVGLHEPAGQYGAYQGFIESDGVYEFLETDDNHPVDINNNGEVVGHLGGSNLNYFRDSDGTYTDIQMAPWGINDNGEILVNYGFASFVYRGGQLTQMVLPSGELAFGDGINDQGQVVGVLVDAPTRCFIATPKPRTTTALNASTNSPNVGESVTLTATVTPTVTGPSPTGTVTFKDGGADIGTGTLESGTATYATSSLDLGPHTLTAAYEGAEGYATSTSAEVTVTVGKTDPICWQCLPGWGGWRATIH